MPTSGSHMRGSQQRKENGEGSHHVPSTLGSQASTSRGTPNVPSGQQPTMASQQQQQPAQQVAEKPWQTAGCTVRAMTRQAEPHAACIPQQHPRPATMPTSGTTSWVKDAASGSPVTPLTPADFPPLALNKARDKQAPAQGCQTVYAPLKKCSEGPSSVPVGIPTPVAHSGVHARTKQDAGATGGSSSGACSNGMTSGMAAASPAGIGQLQTAVPAQTAAVPVAKVSRNNRQSGRLSPPAVQPAKLQDAHNLLCPARAVTMLGTQWAMPGADTVQGRFAVSPAPVMTGAQSGLKAGHAPAGISASDQVPVIQPEAESQQQQQLLQQGQQQGQHTENPPEWQKVSRGKKGKLQQTLVQTATRKQRTPLPVSAPTATAQGHTGPVNVLAGLALYNFPSLSPATAQHKMMATAGRQSAPSSSKNATPPPASANTAQALLASTSTTSPAPHSTPASTGTSSGSSSAAATSNLAPAVDVGRAPAAAGMLPAAVPGGTAGTHPLASGSSHNGAQSVCKGSSACKAPQQANATGNKKKHTPVPASMVVNKPVSVPVNNQGNDVVTPTAVASKVVASVKPSVGTAGQGSSITSLCANNAPATPGGQEQQALASKAPAADGSSKGGKEVNAPAAKPAAARVDAPDRAANSSKQTTAKHCADSAARSRCLRTRPTGNAASQHLGQAPAACEGLMPMRMGKTGSSAEVSLQHDHNSLQTTPPPAPSPASPPQAQPKFSPQATTFLEELACKQAAFLALYSPFMLDAYQSQGAKAAELLHAAVAAVETQPSFKAVQDAIQYCIRRCLFPDSLLSDLEEQVRYEVRDLVRKEGSCTSSGTNMPGIPDLQTLLSGQTNKRQDQQETGKPGKGRATSTLAYMQALMQQSALTDDAPLLRRLDDYMGANTLEGVQHGALDKGAWLKISRGKSDSTALIKHIIAGNNVRVLQYAFDEFPLLLVFNGIVPELEALPAARSVYTGLLLWAKSLGAKCDSLQLIMQALMTPQIGLERQDKMELISYLVADGYPVDLIAQALQACGVPVHFSQETPWLLRTESGDMPGSFLHLVLNRAPPDICAPLVQLCIKQVLCDLPDVDKQAAMSSLVNMDAMYGTPLTLALARKPALPKLDEIVQLLVAHGASPGRSPVPCPSTGPSSPARYAVPLCQAELSDWPENVKQAVTKVLLSAKPWQPLWLLDLLHPSLPKEQLKRMHKFALDHADILLAPLRVMSTEELQPFKDAALCNREHQFLLDLLLQQVPDLKWPSVEFGDIIAAEHLETLLECGTNIKLPCQVPFNQHAASGSEVDGHALKDVIASSLQAAEAAFDPKSVLDWTGENWSNSMSCFENEIRKLQILLSCQDGNAQSYAAYIVPKSVKAALLFGHGRAASKSAATLLRQFLQLGSVDPNGRDEHRSGMTLLQLAASDCAADAVDALLAYGADPCAPLLPCTAMNLCNNSPGSLLGYTALHFIVRQFVAAEAHAKQQGLPVEGMHVKNLLDADQLRQTLQPAVGQGELPGWNPAGYAVLTRLLASAPNKLPGITAGSQNKTPRKLIGNRQGLIRMYDQAYDHAHKSFGQAKPVEGDGGVRQEPVIVGLQAGQLHTESSGTASSHVPTGLEQATGNNPAQQPEQLEEILSPTPGRELLQLIASDTTPLSLEGVPLATLLDAWAQAPAGPSHEKLLNRLIKDLAERSGARSTAPAAQRTASTSEAAAAAPAAAGISSLRHLLPEGQHTWEGTDAAPTSSTDNSLVPEPEETPGLQPSPEDVEALLQDPSAMEWPVVVMKQARKDLAGMEGWAQNAVFQRLFLMSSGTWQRSSLAKLLPNRDDPRLQGMELWRLKINKPGRVLFEVAVEYSETQREWTQCLRIWCITLDHKVYERAIDAAKESYRRSQQVQQRRRLQLVSGDGADSTAGATGAAQNVRQPNWFREVGSDGTVAAGVQTAGESSMPMPQLRDHMPPAAYDADEFTLLKMYSVTRELLNSVIQCMSDKEVELPFVLSPAEIAIIKKMPDPPSSTILVGRSGTGKTTCALFRMYGHWLASLKPFAPEQHAMDPDKGRRTIMVTASTILSKEFKRSFRKLQAAALDKEQLQVLKAGSEVTYHSLALVPIEMFPLFLTSREYLEMLDATTPSPFFKRQKDGKILQVKHDTSDPEGTDIVVDPYFDEDSASEEGFEESEDESSRSMGLSHQHSTSWMSNIEYQHQMQGNAKNRNQDDDTTAKQAKITKAGIADKNDEPSKVELTWFHFQNTVWKAITTSKQQSRLSPALVWTEICSYIKGSMEAMRTKDGHLGLDEYLELGKKRASNFSRDSRETDVYPIFLEYERYKARHNRRSPDRQYYDKMDFVAHLYRQPKRDLIIDALYRDEVQDFTQAEMALDLQLVTDKNALFYCGDTAQTIARGVGFRFEDIKALMYEEGRQQQAQQPAAGGSKQTTRQINMPHIAQLTMNYRTHQGILNVAALLVDILKAYYPCTIDNLEREKALLSGPGPLLLGKLQEDDFSYLMSGDRRPDQRVEFGANQVILLRDHKQKNNLPDDVKDSALVLTVGEAKGLEFHDVFLVDFFADSPADASEWRVLNSFAEQLQKQAASSSNEPVQDYKVLLEQYQQHGSTVAVPDKEQQGYLRAAQVDRAKHVLLQEELKHLYTAITRAKNNVVIFDSSHEKRAPFYNLLEMLGMARIVRKSLLEDGSDAVRYSLSQHAHNSHEEWHKRAKSLMDRNMPDKAVQAYRQAGDFVRAEVAAARHLRSEAAGAIQEGQQGTLTSEDKQKRLADAAFRLLSAVSHADEAPVPVAAREKQKWIRLAAQCLLETKVPSQVVMAAHLLEQLQMYKSAREHLEKLGDSHELAQLCLRAQQHYQKKAELALEQPACDTSEQDAAKMERYANVYVVKAAMAFYAAGAFSQCVQLLYKHQGSIGDTLRSLWPAVNRALLSMATMLQGKGQYKDACMAVQMLPDSLPGKEELLRKCEPMWDELVKLHLKRRDCLGLAKLLLSQQRHLQAAALLAHLLAARSAALVHKQSQQCQQQADAHSSVPPAAIATSLPPPVELPLPGSAWEDLTTYAVQTPIPAEAVSLLAICVMAAHTTTGIDWQRLPQLEPAAEEAGAVGQLQALRAHLRLKLDILQPQGAQQDGAAGAHAGQQIGQHQSQEWNQLKQEVAQAGSWLSCLELAYHHEARALASLHLNNTAPATKVIQLLAALSCQPDSLMGDSVASSTHDKGGVGATMEMQLLTTCSAWLKEALDAFQGISALQRQQDLTGQQTTAVQVLERHYGLAPTHLPGANAHTSLLSSGHRDIYLGNATYVWLGITQQAAAAAEQGTEQAPPWDPEKKAVPQAQHASCHCVAALPLQAQRSTILHTLAWDVHRKLQLVVVLTLLRTLAAHLAALQQPHLLATVVAAGAHMAPLLACMQFLQNWEQVDSLRGNMLNWDAQQRRANGDCSSSGKSAVFPDPHMPISAAAQQNAVRHTAVISLLQQAVSACAMTNGLLPVRPAALSEAIISGFKHQMESTCGINPRVLGSAAVTLHNAKFPNSAQWQGVNFTCWWAFSMLLQDPGMAGKRVAQRTRPPSGADTNLYVVNDQGKRQLPEELLSVASAWLDDGLTDHGMYWLLLYLDKSMSLMHRSMMHNAQHSTAVHRVICLEPLVLLFEVAASTLTLGMGPVPNHHSDNGAPSPSAYIPAACLDLLMELPVWGLKKGNHRPFNISEVLTYWRKTVRQPRTYHWIGLLLSRLQQLLPQLLTAPNAVLAATPQHQMLDLCLTQADAGTQPPMAVLPGLSDQAQRVKAVLLAQRLVHVLACMLLSMETSVAMLPMENKPTYKKSAGNRAIPADPPTVCALLRQVLQQLQQTLQQAPIALRHAAVKADTFDYYAADKLTNILNARSMEVLFQTALALVPDIYEVHVLWNRRLVPRLNDKTGRLKLMELPAAVADLGLITGTQTGPSSSAATAQHPAGSGGPGGQETMAVTDSQDTHGDDDGDEVDMAPAQQGPEGLPGLMKQLLALQLPPSVSKTFAAWRQNAKQKVLARRAEQQLKAAEQLARLEVLTSRVSQLLKLYPTFDWKLRYWRWEKLQLRLLKQTSMLDDITEDKLVPEHGVLANAGYPVWADAAHEELQQYSGHASFIAPKLANVVWTLSTELQEESEVIMLLGKPYDMDAKYTEFGELYTKLDRAETWLTNWTAGHNEAWSHLPCGVVDEWASMHMFYMRQLEDLMGAVEQLWDHPLIHFQQSTVEELSHLCQNLSTLITACAAEHTTVADQCDWVVSDPMSIVRKAAAQQFEMFRMIHAAIACDSLWWAEVAILATGRALQFHRKFKACSSMAAAAVPQYQTNAARRQALISELQCAQTGLLTGRDGVSKAISQVLEDHAWAAGAATVQKASAALLCAVLPAWRLLLDSGHAPTLDATLKLADGSEDDTDDYGTDDNTDDSSTEGFGDDGAQSLKLPSRLLDLAVPLLGRATCNKLLAPVTQFHESAVWPADTIAQQDQDADQNAGSAQQSHQALDIGPSSSGSQHVVADAATPTSPAAATSAAWLVDGQRTGRTASSLSHNAAASEAMEESLLGEHDPALHLGVDNEEEEEDDRDLNEWVEASKRKRRGRVARRRRGG